MNFTLLDTKFSISIYLIIGCIILWIILSTNLFCAGCRVTPYEGFVGAAKAVNTVAQKASGKPDTKLKKAPIPTPSAHPIISPVKAGTEAFVGANINHGESSNYNDKPVSTASWFSQDLTNPNSKGYQELVNRPKQPIPLPEGEMLLFANTPFKPECCDYASSYSNGSGCACMTVGPNSQYNYLIGRGGNNAVGPNWSEY